MKVEKILLFYNKVLIIGFIIACGYLIIGCTYPIETILLLNNLHFSALNYLFESFIYWMVMVVNCIFILSMLYIKSKELIRQRTVLDGQCNLDLKSQINHAIRNKEFTLYYQPIIDIHKSSIVGLEALMRWNNPQRGFISPNIFIPVAESTGQILKVEEWLFDEVFKSLKYLELYWKGIFFISMNISSKGLINEDIVSYLRNLSVKYNVNPAMVELEITETSIMDNLKKSISILSELKSIGFRIAIDDFGTGYSSLSYLKELPISVVKIDKCFIDTIIESEKDKCLVDLIIKLCQKLDLTVIAEGVETPEQLLLLRDLNCKFVQGYIYSKPEPIEQIIKRLKENEIAGVIENVDSKIFVRSSFEEVKESI